MCIRDSRRDAKIKFMKDIILVLKKKLNSPERLLEILEDNFSGFPLEMIINNFSNDNRSKSVSYTHLDVYKRQL